MLRLGKYKKIHATKSLQAKNQAERLFMQDCIHAAQLVNRLPVKWREGISLLVRTDLSLLMAQYCLK